MFCRTANTAGWVARARSHRKRVSRGNRQKSREVGGHRRLSRGSFIPSECDHSRGPPLRERPEDIIPLCNAFVEQYRAKYKSTVQALPEELLRAFARYSWPGNIRQLENNVKRFLILPDVRMALLELQRGKLLPEIGQRPGGSLGSLKEQSASAAESAEKELILRTLTEVNWNRKLAGRP